MSRKHPPDLPPAVQLHVHNVLMRTDWAHIAETAGDVCKGCPADGADIPPDDSPCYSCPLWSWRLDLAQLRLLRRLEDGS